MNAIGQGPIIGLVLITHGGLATEFLAAMANGKS